MKRYLQDCRGDTWFHHVANKGDRMMGPIFRLMVPFALVFMSLYLFWPKTDYIYDLLCGIVKGRRENTEYTKQIWDCKDGKGKRCHSHPQFLIHLHHREEEGLVHWSNLYHLSLCTSLIRVTWAALYDCDHICITRWWIFYYWDNLWDANF
jgi:hypothetical protein